jgi:hypothetical protein
MMTNIPELFAAIALGPPGIIAVLVAHSTLYPDITYGYEILNNTSTLGTRGVILHEFAHGSHHLVVGDNIWDRIRLHIVVNSIANNGVYGQVGNFAIGSSPEFVAIAEGWAFHYGFFLTGRTVLLEGSKFLWVFNGDGILVNSGYIPLGLGLDLLDTRNFSDPSGYNDQVEGFSNRQYFDALVPFVLNMPALRSFYLDHYINTTSNTPAQVNSLFDEYNF